MKGLTSVTTVAPKAPAIPETRTTRASSNSTPSPASLTHTNTSTSLNTLATAASRNTVSDGKNDERILYPFRVRHLGKELYTLFASSAQNRQEWCDKIVDAQTAHAAALFAQNAEPFRLRVMADSAFAYEGATAGQRGITIRGTPLDRAVQEAEQLFRNAGRPSPICRAKVNCATSFQDPYEKKMVAVGTDYGVYISEISNPRGWTRAIGVQKVTQVAVLEEFSMFLLISDKSLYAYHLDMVLAGSTGGGTGGSGDSRRAPQKLSGSREVGFFTVGKMKERTLVFYKKKEGLHSHFKVCLTCAWFV